MKVVVPNLASVLKASQDKGVTLAVLKCIGSFASQACLTPQRMANFYRDSLDNEVISDICKVIAQVSDKVEPCHLVAVQTLSMIINPAFGDTFSFPWNRGPHD